MCAEHSPNAFSVAATDSTAANPPIADSAWGKPTSREFAVLKLSGARAGVYHCSDHVHPVNVILQHLGRSQGEGAALPLFPVFPSVTAASVTERLTGNVTLDAAGYQSTASPVRGEVAVSMAHARSSWGERLERYRKRYRVADENPVAFSAGFAVLKGQAGIAFDPAQGVVRDDGLGLTFTGRMDGHPLFSAVQGRPEGDCEILASYHLQEGRVPRGVPLWIVPSLEPSSDKRVLVIDLHWNWNMIAPDVTPPDLERFELIELRVPRQWGGVESFSPANAAIPPPVAGQPQVIRWRQYKPAMAGSQRSGAAASTGSLTLLLRFEKQILDYPRLSGQVRATFNRTLSGVTGMDFYLPGGGPAEDLGVRARTEVSVEFDISLSALRYQDRRSVPDESDRGMVGDPAQTRRKEDTFAGVVPDYRTIIELTDAISKDGYYVKSVVESAPNHDDPANIVKRTWDITGRWYDGVFPIDFTISLWGTEKVQGGSGPGSETTVQVRVGGMYPNTAMKLIIEAAWDGLHAKVTRILAARAMADPPASGRIAPVPLVPEIGVPVALDSPDPNIIPGEVVEESDLPYPGETGRARAELQRQSRDLRRARYEGGEISEITYRQAVADIRAEQRYFEQFLAGDEAGDEEVTGLLRQRRALRRELIAGQLSEDAYREDLAEIAADLKDLGWEA
jgi:hypothetical protein